MRVFKDNEGRSWTVNINVAVLRCVRDILKIDLMEAVDGKLVTQIADDPALLCDILYLIIKDQAEERDLSDEQFGRSLAGDVIDEAATAFLEELVDFFPKLRRRPLKTVLDKVKKHEEAAMHHIEGKVNSIDVETEIQKAMNSGDKQVNLQESLELTPEDSH